MEFQSKWGWHPCDYETYQKLRVLNKFTYQNEGGAARWWRWARKAPHNRVGEEPFLVQFFAKKGHCGGDGRYSVTQWNTRLVDKIRADKKNAQYPKEKREQVAPLILTRQEINYLYDSLPSWVIEGRGAF